MRWVQAADNIGKNLKLHNQIERCPYFYTRVPFLPTNNAMIFWLLLSTCACSCDYDYVEVTGGAWHPPGLLQSSGGRICGNWNERIKLLRFTASRSMQITFVSDFSHAFKGFKAEVLIVNDDGMYVSYRWTVYAYHIPVRGGQSIDLSVLCFSSFVHFEISYSRLAHRKTGLHTETVNIKL